MKKIIHALKKRFDEIDLLVFIMVMSLGLIMFGTDFIK